MVDANEIPCCQRSCIVECYLYIDSVHVGGQLIVQLQSGTAAVVILLQERCTCENSREQVGGLQREGCRSKLFVLSGGKS